MKILNILLIAILVTLSSAAFAQPMKAGVTSTTYKSSIPGWMVNVQQANVESSKTGKPIMANFTGSDWCGWCKKLRREVFDTPEFKAWAEKNVILLELDYPRSFQLPDDLKQQNAQLQKAFSVSGYPTIWFFNLTNNDQGQFSIDALGSVGYVAGGPKAWIAKADAILNKK